MTEFRRFLRNALVLVGASLLMRSISLLFGAFVSRQVGAEGMGLFALVGSVYGFAVTLATSGIQLAVTRLCAAAQERGDLSRMAAVLRHAALYAALFGGLSAVLLFSFAAPIGTMDVPMGSRCRSETATVWRYDLMWKVMFSVRVRAILPVA